MKIKEISVKKPINYYLLAGLLGIIGFLLYANTIGHEYVLDDNFAISNNLYVQEGISGIPKLFTVDFWFFENTKLGYYRPLGLSTFAIEHEFFGNNPHVGHFDNALLFGITAVVLFIFLVQFFSERNIMIPFFITAIFIAHPIHTEAVANIKSRDEILSFLNLFVMLYFVLRYQKSKKRNHLIWGLIFFYLALISKETAVVGLALIPLFLFYNNNNLRKVLLKSLPFAGVAILFFIQKNYFLGNEVVIPHDIVNYPYTSKLVKLPTLFHIFTICLAKLVIPWPLSYDYSFNQIPASHWSDGPPWVGLLLFISLGIMAIYGVLKRTDFGLAFAIIFITLAPSLGFIFLRGGILAERFLYAPSLGFAIILVLGIWRLLKGVNDPKPNPIQWITKNPAMAGAIFGLAGIYGYMTVDRNPVWKNQMALFSTDSKHSANSCQAHKHYGTALMEDGRFEKDSSKRKQDFTIGINELQRALEINPEFSDAYYQIGFGYQLVEINLDSAIKYYKKCIEMAPAYARALNNIGIVYHTKGNIPLASYYYNKAAEANPNFADGVKNAAYVKKSTGLDVKIFPGEDNSTGSQGKSQSDTLPVNVKKFNEYSKTGSDAVNKNDFVTAIKNFKKAAELFPEDKQNLIYLANSYGMAGKLQDAVNTFNRILSKYPDDKMILNNLSRTYDAMGQKDKAEDIRKQLK